MWHAKLDGRRRIWTDSWTDACGRIIELIAGQVLVCYHIIPELLMHFPSDVPYQFCLKPTPCHAKASKLETPINPLLGTPSSNVNLTT